MLSQVGSVVQLRILRYGAGPGGQVMECSPGGMAHDWHIPEYAGDGLQGSPRREYDREYEQALTRLDSDTESAFEALCASMFSTLGEKP